MESNGSAQMSSSGEQLSPPILRENGGETGVVRWSLLTFVLLILVALSMVAFFLLPNLRNSISTADADGTTALTQETLRIADELQCPVCEGQSVAYSNSQLATEMRRQVEEKLAAGESEAAIKQFFVDRYGVRVLREPPRTGLNLWLWRLPIIGLVIGLAGLTWNLQNMTRKHNTSQKKTLTPQTVPPSTSEDDLVDSEVKELLVQYDRDLFR